MAVLYNYPILHCMLQQFVANNLVVGSILLVFLANFCQSLDLCFQLCRHFCCMQPLSIGCGQVYLHFCLLLRCLQCGRGMRISIQAAAECAGTRANRGGSHAGDLSTTIAVQVHKQSSNNNHTLLTLHLLNLFLL